MRAALICILFGLATLGCVLDRGGLGPHHERDASLLPPDAAHDEPALDAFVAEPDAALVPDAWAPAEDAATCELEGCVLPGTCPYDWLPVIAPSERVTVQLCGASDDHQASVDACGADANGEDTLVRVLIGERARYRFIARDVDGPAAIDTVVYLRRACEVESSEVACADDVRCDDADDDLRGTCEMDRQPRMSRFEVELDPGDYFAVIDSRIRPGFGCGMVEFRVDMR